MRRFIGAGLLAVAAFMGLGFAQVGTLSFATLIALLIGSGIPAGAGLYLLFGGRSKGTLTELRGKTIDAELIRLAGRLGGKLTVVEVVAGLALSKDEAESHLDELARQGIAEIEVTDSGQLVYDFPAVRLLEEKDSSRGVLDG